MRHTLKRALTPATNPAGLGSAAAAIYAAVVMILNATSHRGVIDPQVIVAAIAAAAFLYSRMKVTPVADPKDGNGQPLVAAVTAPAQKTLLPPGYPASGPPMTSLPPTAAESVTLNPPAAPE